MASPAPHPKHGAAELLAIPATAACLETDTWSQGAIRTPVGHGGFLNKKPCNGHGVA